MKTCVLLLFLNLLLIPAADSGAQNRPGSPSGNITREFYVNEEIFNSRMFMLEAGVDHKQSIILVHGLGNDASQIWKTTVQQLAQNYHVIAFDLPGFGRSEATNALYSPKNYSKLLAWIVKKFAKQEHSVIGHSLGGAIALMYSATKPAAMQRLVLVDVAGILHRSSVMEKLLQPTIKDRLPGFPESLSDSLDNLIGTVIHSAETAPIDTKHILNSPLLRKTLLGNNPAKIAALALIETDFSPIVFQYVGPTLILWGEKDTTSPLRTGYLLDSTLPNSQFRTISGSGHSPMKDSPAVFFSQLREFLTSPDNASKTDPPNSSNQKYVAQNVTGRIISGDYQLVDLSNCQNITLRNLRAKRLILRNTSASLENVRVKGTTKGLSLIGANIVASGLKIEAPQALSVVKSRADLAGVDIRGDVDAISCDQESYLLFSASRLKSAGEVMYLHGPWKK